MDKKKKFAIYVRVSRTDQILENQINPLVEYCKRMDWDYEIFQEKESTRKTRPVQWDLYNRLLKKEFDGLLFYKLDRWARSLRELVTHMETLYEKGVIIVSFMENIDLSTSTGKLMMNIILFLRIKVDVTLWEVLVQENDKLWLYLSWLH